jgi:hypothetical protein
MRQFLTFAWSVTSCVALAACNGQEFAPLEQRSTDEDDSTTTSNQGNLGGHTSGGSGTSAAGTSQGGTSSTPPTSPNAGSSSAGSPGAGGNSSGGGGGASSGGGSDADCSGPVQFKMLPGPDLPHDFLCDATCGAGWLTISDAAGATVFSIFPACGTASCEVCEPLPCAAGACLPAPLSTEGRELSWDGTYLAPGTCGNNLACQGKRCMAPGSYRAKACVAISAGSSGTGSCTPKDDAKLCAEVEFELPAASEVKLVLQQ